MGLLGGKKHFQVEGKHVIITGASQGLGLALGPLLAARGAHITVMARTVAKLEEAVKHIESHCRSPQQKIAYVSVDLRNAKDVERAFDEACKPFEGKAPDIVMAVAGAASGIYGFFTEMSEEQFRAAFETNYFTSCWTAREAARRMARQQVKGHIVLVSSIAGLLGYAGSSAYSPAKAGLRSLADCLRNEFLLYDIKIHCHFPGGIESPGFVSEQIGKPDIAKDIEKDDVHLDPTICGQRLLDGLDRGYFFVSTDTIGHFARTGLAGPSPGNNLVLDMIFGFLARIGLPIWRMQIDGMVKKSSKDHLERLHGQAKTQ